MQKKDLYEGCLLGGAIGDALGYPVEFLSEKSIREIYGQKGIRTLSQAGKPAVVSDDTQMTLFAADALLCAMSNPEENRDWILRGYQEWLATQNSHFYRKSYEGAARMWLFKEERLHASRAPGNTCLSALGRTVKKKYADPAANNSKGCGTVMRAAPFGLAVRYAPDDSISAEEALKRVHELAVHDAALTHGHPDAQLASSLLAQIIFKIVQYRSEREEGKALQDVIRTRGISSARFNTLIEDAVGLALDVEVSDLDAIHGLGEGWVADEAFAIALFCAVRYQDDFAAAIRAAVNHKGDSDSTGAICGNILGAWLGVKRVEEAFDLSCLELVDVIRCIADDLYRAVECGVPAEGTDKEWDGKYRMMHDKG